MIRAGSKGGSMCPLFCCLFINHKCCCANSSDEEDSFDENDIRRPLTKSKQYRKYYSQKRSKPRDVNNKKKNRAVGCGTGCSASPIIHSGLKRLPFAGTLSDLTERSEEESCTLSSVIFEEEEPSFQFQYDDASLIISEVGKKQTQHGKWGENDSGVKAKAYCDRNVDIGGATVPQATDNGSNVKSKK